MQRALPHHPHFPIFSRRCPIHLIKSVIRGNEYENNAARREEDQYESGEQSPSFPYCFSPLIANVMKVMPFDEEAGNRTGDGRSP